MCSRTKKGFGDIIDLWLLVTNYFIEFYSPPGLPVRYIIYKLGDHPESECRLWIRLVPRGPEGAVTS